jgi:hypothetical protein
MIAEYGFFAWICNPFQDDWNLRKTETYESLESGTYEVLESEIREDRELQWAVIFVNKRFEDQGEDKSKTSSQKSGFRVWTSGKHVNVWNQPCKSQGVKDIRVHVHTRNIP